jgi:TPR repeat protein
MNRGGSIRLALMIGVALLAVGCDSPSVHDAMTAYQKGDFATAVSLFQPLAEDGDPVAQVDLGLMYNNGQGVTRDYEQAVKWYRLAAEQGNADGQAALGTMYDNGHGVAQDDKEAVKWYRLAAQQGVVVAQYNLGVMHKNGRGVAQDTKRAYMWFNFAAAKGQQGASEKRDEAAEKLTPAEIAEAGALARKCEGSGFKDCD